MLTNTPIEKTKRGRKPDPNKIVFKKAGLRPGLWTYLRLYAPSAIATDTQCLEEAMLYLRKMRPEGPVDAPRCYSCGQWTRPGVSVCHRCDPETVDAGILGEAKFGEPHEY